MTTKKYALGMGDTDFLNDGVYETLNEAHTEALRLKDLEHDNGECHTSYMIGEVVSSPLVAVESAKAITDSVAEFIGDEVDELEDFNGVFDNFITIDEEGRSKIEAVLKDVLLNHTKYPKNEVIKDLKTFIVEDNDN